MLWRVRTTLPDRPGALATLAQRCGDAGVNILGLQIFPGIEAVTDELVLRVPDDWSLADLAALVEEAGGERVSAARCTEQALVDQPARYVQAARTILAQPASFPEVVARLFEAESEPGPGHIALVQDVMELVVGDVQVQIRRTAPFTATEHARGAAMAELVGDLLVRSKAEAPVMPAPGRRLGSGARPTYEVNEASVAAVVDGTVVGLARVLPEGPEPGVRAVSLRVDPAWQRRGIGTRLLGGIARVAADAGLDQILLVTRADNQAVLPMVMSAGLKGRIRLSGDRLAVRVPVREQETVAV